MEKESLDTYDIINHILVQLFHEIWKREEEAIVTDEFQDITNNDMHIIEAVGLLNETNNMSGIAKKLGITVGSLTTAMNSLVQKGYVIRERSEQDRRVVFIRLTKKGEKAYWHHKEFHHLMTKAVMEKLKEEEIPILIKMLQGLSEFFRDYGEKKPSSEKQDRYPRNKKGSMEIPFTYIP